MSRRGGALFIALCLLWGIPYFLIKVAVDELTPAVLVFLRTGLGALILLPIAAHRRALRPLLAVWPWMLLFTAIEVAVPWLALSWAEQRLPSALAGLLVAAVPLVSVLIAVALGSQHHLGATGLAGLGLGFAGVASLVGLDVHGAQTGAILAMVAVVFGYAMGPVILSRRLSHLPSVGVISASLALCALVYLPLAVVQAPAQWPSAKVSWSVVVLAVLCTAVAFLVFFALIAEWGPVRPTVVTYVNPAVAVLAGVLFLSERVTAGTLVGFTLILAGSVLATRRPAPALPERAAAA